MFDSRTYFAQVPLEVVQKIVEEQMQLEGTSEAEQQLDQETLSESLCEKKQRITTPPLTLSQKETTN